MTEAADSARQSLRLALGAALLIAGGLGLMLADGTVHPSAALSSAFVSRIVDHPLFDQSK